MNFENILFEKKDAIAYVTVNRPKVLNALNMATMEELRAAFHEVKNDHGVRVVIMTGSGEKAFIAGADIGELAKHDAVSRQGVYPSRAERAKPDREPGQAGDRLHQRIRARRRMRNCDGMHYASGERKRQARAARGEAWNHPRLRRDATICRDLVGKGIAMQLVLAGEMISAQEAHRIGLVNEVVSAPDLIPRAEAIAQKIIANAPLAVQYAMEAVNKGMEMTLAEGLYLEAVLFGVACASEDKKEGTTAFLEKRAAQFKGK